MALVSLAAWTPTRVRYKDREIVLERGQLALSVRDLARHMDWSKGKAERFLDRLINRDMVKTHNKTGVNVISICNYEKYQGSKEDAGTLMFSEPGHDRDTTGTQNKEGKELKKERKEKYKSAWAGGEVPLEWRVEMATKLRWSKAQTDAEAERFIDDALAHRRTYVDWRAAWRNWCRSPFCKTKREALQL